MSKTKYLLENQIIYDGQVFTKDKRGYYLSALPFYNGRRILLHRYIWAKYNSGSIPDGYVIHHKDGNKENNDISNLIAIPKNKHSKIHIDEEMKKHFKERKKRFLESAHPAAIEWHKSKEGREWHKKQWEISLKPYVEKTKKKKCIVCGKEYEVTLAMFEKSKYCSKKCKAKYRRDNKLDYITKKCVVCGKEFKTSKYKGAKTCSKECKIKLSLYNRDGKRWD